MGFDTDGIVSKLDLRSIRASVVLLVVDSIRTKVSCLEWIKHSILFHNKKHPPEMGAPQVEGFLIYFAIDFNVAASTTL